MSRILFFTPVGRVLDSAQQANIVAYAENRKTLHRPLDKLSFWRSIGICNNQNATNVINTLSVEEVEDTQHPKGLEIRK